VWLVFQILPAPAVTVGQFSTIDSTAVVPVQTVQTSPYISDFGAYLALPTTPKAARPAITSEYSRSNFDRGPNSKLPKYDGKSVRWRTFLGQFESMIARYNWYGEEAERLGECLTGYPLEVYYNFPREIRSNYLAIRDRLSSLFWDAIDPISKQFTLMHTVQESSESLGEYASKLLCLANEAYPGNPLQAEQTAKEVFLAGCSEREVARSVRMGAPKSLQEALMGVKNLAQHDQVLSNLQNFSKVATESSYKIRAYNADKNSPPRSNDRRYQNTRYSPDRQNNYYRSRDSPRYRGSPPASPPDNRRVTFSDSDSLSHLTRAVESVTSGMSKMSSDMNQFKSDMSSFKSDISSGMGRLRSDLTSDMGKLKSEVGRISEVNSQPNQTANGAASLGPRSPSRSASPTEGQVICFRCQQPGHFVRNCPVRSPSRSDQDRSWRTGSPSRSRSGSPGK
jgi:hypothetical protein